MRTQQSIKTQSTQKHVNGARSLYGRLACSRCIAALYSERPSHSHRRSSAGCAVSQRISTLCCPRCFLIPHLPVLHFPASHFCERARIYRVENIHVCTGHLEMFTQNCWWNLTADYDATKRKTTPFFSIFNWCHNEFSHINTRKAHCVGHTGPFPPAYAKPECTVPTSAVINP